MQKPIAEIEVKVDVEDDKLVEINFDGHLDGRIDVERMRIMALQLSETLEQIIKKYELKKEK